MDIGGPIESDDDDGDENDDDSDTLLNGELLLDSNPSPLQDVTTEPTEDHENDKFPEDLSRRYSDPPPLSSSYGTVGGDVESVVAINDITFSSNGHSHQDYQKFLRRFISTQVRSMTPDSNLCL